MISERIPSPVRLILQTLITSLLSFLYDRSIQWHYFAGKKSLTAAILNPGSGLLQANLTSLLLGIWLNKGQVSTSSTVPVPGNSTCTYFMFVYELPTLLKGEKVYVEQTIQRNSVGMILLFAMGIYLLFLSTHCHVNKFMQMREGHLFHLPRLILNNPPVHSECLKKQVSLHGWNIPSLRDGWVCSSPVRCTHPSGDLLWLSPRCDPRLLRITCKKTLLLSGCSKSE